MTNPFIQTDDPDELRKRWLNRYLRVQAQYDTRIRTVLIEGAEDVFTRLSALEHTTQFSAGVRRAQLRLAMQEIRTVLNDVFKTFIPIINNGSKSAASSAVDAFGETDRRFLESAFRESAMSDSAATTRQLVDQFIEGQRRSSMLGVAHLVSRLYKSDQPLSTRVYKTRYLANQWVQKQVNLGLLRGASAKQIAFTVRKSIRPNTPGGVSYAAMRLGRTEINNAFHATSIALSQDRPWVEGMAWHLSETHENNDSVQPEICEVYAGQSWQVDKVPAKPHPQCRCFVTPQVEPFESFITHLTSGQYRDWIRNAA